MKKKIIAVGLSVLMLIGSFAAYTPDGSGSVLASIGNTKKRTVSVDFNGDGKKETVKFVPSGYDYYMYKKLTVYVNGKKVKNFNNYFYSYDFKTLKLKNGKSFLFIHTSAENDDGSNRVYTYKGGKLSVAINFDKINGCRYVSGLKTKGNQVLVTMGDTDAPGLGAMSFESSYTYKNGKFSLDSTTHEVTSYLNFNTGENGILELTSITDFDIYSDEKCIEYIGTVPEGATVKVTKTYRTNKFISMYVEGNDYAGWYTIKEYDYEHPYLFDGVGGVA